MLTQAWLQHLLHYDPVTGEWMWVHPLANCLRPGDIAGTIGSNGYRKIKIKCCTYASARLAHLYMTGEWPEDEMDHINRVRYDDRWENLRPATGEQNAQNRSIRHDNKSGAVGIVWHKQHQQWRVKVNEVHYGYYESFDEAVEVRDNAIKSLHGDFAKLNTGA